jgi:hypothetical protein
VILWERRSVLRETVFVFPTSANAYTSDSVDFHSPDGRVQSLSLRRRLMADRFDKCWRRSFRLRSKSRDLRLPVHPNQ